MKAAPYDIFRKDLLGTPVWMETVQDIETAKLRIMELVNRSPGEYFVFSQETQEIVCDTAPRFFALALVPVFSQIGNESHSCFFESTRGQMSRSQLPFASGLRVVQLDGGKEILQNRGRGFKNSTPTSLFSD